LLLDQLQMPDKLFNKNMPKRDIRLIIPLFLLKKLKVHPLTQGLYPISLGVTQANTYYSSYSKEHNNYYLLYVESGKFKLLTESNKTILQMGEVVLLPASRKFTLEAELVNGQSKAYWVNFSGSLAPNFAERLEMKMTNDLANVGVLANVISDFDDLISLGQRGYTATNVIHAVHLLQQTLSYLALQLRLPRFNKNSSFDLEAIENLMKNNLHQELNLDTLAHYSQLSKFHFSKKFKELTDTSPIQYFINLKMQHACYLLDHTSKSIKQIGEELGYADPYYFSRLFKKMVGMSPKIYRESV